jgi:hypothetical protein
MKKALFFLYILLPLVCFSQQSGSVVLDWEDNGLVTYDSYTIKVPKFKGDSFSFNPKSKSILLNMIVPLSSSVDERSLQISNTVYEPILVSNLGQLDQRIIPSSINASLLSVKSRSSFSAILSLSPIIKGASGYMKLVSFTYSFQLDLNKTAIDSNRASGLSKSVLHSGDWYRFYVERSGVYKISKDFLQQLGFNVNVDPRTIKIYGNGGRMLPLLNSVDYPLDLAENAIQFIGENDGTFNNEDYILFYAEGVDNWNAESETHLNLYDSKSYYYVSSSADFGKRMQIMSQPSGATALTIATFDDYQFHEVDLVNVVRTGRRWFGESFAIDNDQEFKFDFPNIVPNSSIGLTVVAGSAAFTSTSLKVKANNQEVGTIPFFQIYSNSSTELDINSLPANATFPAASSATIQLTYNNNGVPSSKGYLDYIVVKAKRNLQGYGKQFRFQYNAAVSVLGIGEYQINNAQSINQVWDVTDLYNCTRLTNASQNSFVFKANLGELRKYIAVDPSDYYTPLKESRPKVVNQDLKGTVFMNNQGQFQDLDYLIITPSSFYNQAEKLASFHRNYSKLNVKVLTLESIYQEFSSGKQDISAIRNLVKYVYENASSVDKRIKYLNLFGDASFDFKNRIPNNTNIVPIYHALDGTTAGEISFASDDFFGCMDPNEGNATGYFSGIDIAVGRMLVSTTQQADEMVNKVLEYHDAKSFGNWRNNVVFISDDSDISFDASLQFRQNRLADKVGVEKPFLNVGKILLDSYVQETSSGGNRYPKAREDLFNAFDKGALVFNYLGHGGEDGLTGERLWEKLDGQNLSNRYKYPLFITITCDFSRFDNPYRPTAGEYTYWNPKGGAISMITTIRSIGQGAAEFFNDRLAQYLFSYGSNTYYSIAESLRLAKNSNPNSATNVVFYIGDPAIMLAIPKPKIRLTKVNDVPVSGSIDDFKSLAYVKLSGEITDENNTLNTTYNGELALAIFDKTISKSTFNNDGNSPPMNFNVSGQTIFRGNASVANGQFEFGFVVPRDIKIPLGNGKVSFYAKNESNANDNAGYDTSIKIGGVNTNAAVDNLGPQAKLYMNDQTFISGGITNESPLFLAYLEDENGINTASGIGHDIVAILDGNENAPYILNDYYETELNNFKKGILRFPLKDLAKGLHTITFKAWDVYNNPIVAEIQFLVVGDETLTLTNVLNYPNPFVNYTQFWFTHNRPFEPLEVQVQVMTITGKVVWTKNQVVTTEGFLSREISWDGKDDFGDKIGKGVYVYKLTVKSILTNKKSEKFEKLVIL